MQHLHGHHAQRVAPLDGVGDRVRANVDRFVFPVLLGHAPNVAVVLCIGVQGRPVVYAAIAARHEVLRELEAERVAGYTLVLGRRVAENGAEIQVARPRRLVQGGRDEVIAARHIVAGHLEFRLAVLLPRQHFGQLERNGLRDRVLETECHVRNGGIVGVLRIDRLDQLRAEILQDFEFAIDAVADRRITRMELDHQFPDHADAHACQGLRRTRIAQRADIGHLGREPARQGRVGIVRIEIAGFWIAERIENGGRILDRAANDAGVVLVWIGTDRTGIGDHSLRRNHGHHVVVVRGIAARAAGGFADGADHQIRRHRNAGASARAAGDALRVVRIAGRAGPGIPRAA